MSLMKRVCAALGLSLLCQISAEAAVSQWRALGDGSGTTIEARFEGKKEGLYLLRRRADGKLFAVRPEF
ncbi:MAG: hypothetical protein CFE26_11945, partial [Verrucomicrobiales bacterium VVV1]